MQRVGRSCAVCREPIHLEWIALACESCALAFHPRCRASEHAGYRSGSSAGCSRCGAELHAAMRPPSPSQSVLVPTFADRLRSVLQVSITFVGVLLGVALGPVGFALMTSHPRITSLPNDLWLAAFVFVMSGIVGLSVAALAFGTRWEAITRPAIDTMSSAREPMRTREHS